MFQFANAPALEIKKQIRYRMESNHDFDNDPYFDDVAKIGSFLSDEQLCLLYAKRLNDALVAYARETGVFKTMTKKRLIGTRDALATAPGPGPKSYAATLDPGADTELALTAERHKHHKVLSGLLSRSEAAAGFNEGAYTFGSRDKKGSDVQLSTQVGKAVTLPGIVAPKVFQQELLAKARHFKDPGVGVLHGEYTHRMQWFMVCDYMQVSNNFEHPAADIFKACARPEFCAGRTTVWDLVFEGDFAQDFRKPESFTEFFLRVSQPSHKHHKQLWFLAGLIEGRYAKRQIEKQAG